jgi:hypothetical protein
MIERRERRALSGAQEIKRYLRLRSRGPRLLRFTVSVGGVHLGAFPVMN